MSYEIVDFYTGLSAILSPVSEAPRMALAVTMKGGVSREPIPGMAKLANRLLLKGTENRSTEALARELDERGIDLRELALPDCSILLAVFLNREFAAVLNIIEDVLFHSTFTDFEKEAIKLSGEIRSSLDVPAELAQDLLLRTLFAGHPYGDTGSLTLETLPSMTEDQTREWFYAGLNPRQMNVTLVGEFAPEEVVPQLDDTFARLSERGGFTMPGAILPSRTADQVVTQARADAQQAQVYRGWLAPAVGSAGHAPTAVMNTILGGAGLSSRLFVELRDKLGLAYSVRSQYVPMLQTGELIASIGTSPENITKAQQGFADQISRIQNEPITHEELENAKGRLRGVFVLTHETTSQQCLDMAINHINGLGPDYSSELQERIAGVTVGDVQAAAQCFSSASVTAIVAREDALPE